MSSLVLLPIGTPRERTANTFQLLSVPLLLLPLPLPLLPKSKKPLFSKKKKLLQSKLNKKFKLNKL
jgi:hypothetical protein